MALGHTLNTQTLVNTDEQKKVVSKVTILPWATFRAVLGCTWPAGRELDTPGSTAFDVAEQKRRSLEQHVNNKPRK